MMLKDQCWGSIVRLPYYCWCETKMQASFLLDFSVSSRIDGEILMPLEWADQ